MTQHSHNVAPKQQPSQHHQQQQGQTHQLLTTQQTNNNDGNGNGNGGIAIASNAANVGLQQPQMQLQNNSAASTQTYTSGTVGPLSAQPHYNQPLPVGNIYMPAHGVHQPVGATAATVYPAMMPTSNVYVNNVTANVNLHGWAHTVPAAYIPGSAPHYLTNDVPSDQNGPILQSMPAMQPVALTASNAIVVQPSGNNNSVPSTRGSRRGRGRGGSSGARRNDYNAQRHPPQEGSPVPTAQQQQSQQNQEQITQSMVQQPQTASQQQQPQIEGQVISSMQPAYAPQSHYASQYQYAAYPTAYFSPQNPVLHPAQATTQPAAGPPFLVPIYNGQQFYNYQYIPQMMNTGEYQFVPTEEGDERQNADGIVPQIWHSQQMYSEEYAMNAADMHVSVAGEEMNQNPPSLASSETPGMLSPNYQMYGGPQMHEIEQQMGVMQIYGEQQIAQISGMHPGGAMPEVYIADEISDCGAPPSTIQMVPTGAILAPIHMQPDPQIVHHHHHLHDHSSQAPPHHLLTAPMMAIEPHQEVQLAADHVIIDSYNSNNNNDVATLQSSDSTSNLSEVIQESCENLVQEYQQQITVEELQQQHQEAASLASNYSSSHNASNSSDFLPDTNEMPLSAPSMEALPTPIETVELVIIPEAETAVLTQQQVPQQQQSQPQHHYQHQQHHSQHKYQHNYEQQQPSQHQEHQEQYEHQHEKQQHYHIQQQHYPKHQRGYYSQQHDQQQQHRRPSHHYMHQQRTYIPRFHNNNGGGNNNNNTNNSNNSNASSQQQQQSNAPNSSNDNSLQTKSMSWTNSYQKKSTATVSVTATPTTSNNNNKPISNSYNHSTKTYTNHQHHYQQQQQQHYQPHHHYNQQQQRNKTPSSPPMIGNAPQTFERRQSQLDQHYQRPASTSTASTTAVPQQFQRQEQQHYHYHHQQRYSSPPSKYTQHNQQQHQQHQQQHQNYYVKKAIAATQSVTETAVPAAPTMNLAPPQPAGGAAAAPSSPNTWASLFNNSGNNTPSTNFTITPSSTTTPANVAATQPANISSCVAATNSNNSTTNNTAAIANACGSATASTITTTTKKPVAKVAPYEGVTPVTPTLPPVTPGIMSYSAASAQGLAQPNAAGTAASVSASSTAAVGTRLATTDEATASSKSVDEWSMKFADFLNRYKTDLALISLRPRGLTNRSNYCYINSILQALLGCAPFYNLIRSIPKQAAALCDVKTPTVNAMLSFMGNFTSLPAGLRLNNRLNKAGPKGKDGLGGELQCDSAFEPTEIYKLWNESRDEHVEGRQEDAEEFLGYVLNKLNDEMLEVIKLVTKPTADQNGQDVLSENDDGDVWQMICNNRNKGSVTRQTDFGRTPLSDIFRGELRSRLQREGELSTDVIQPFFTLQLNIEKAASVKEALEILVGRDQLEGVTGSKTKQEVIAWQQMTLEKLPVVLILHLKWFDYRSDGCTKILKTVEFPVELRIDPKILASKKYSQKQRIYRLFAVVYHDGKEASKGHYITDVYHTGYSSWLRFDDSSVKPVSEHNVLHPHMPRVPYLLYYRRCDTLPQSGAHMAAISASALGNSSAQTAARDSKHAHNA